jgi:hypothetical protein
MCFLWGTYKPMEFSFKQRTGRWIMSRIVRVILMYYRHKPIYSIVLLGSQRGRNVVPVSYEQTYEVELS